MSIRITVCMAALCAMSSAQADNPPVDPCAGVSSCFDAGAFVADVIQVSPSGVGNGGQHQVLTLTLRFRNVGAQPVVLAYRSTSSAAVDNFGNRYTWGRPGTYDTSVKGIGSVDARRADPQFALSPGQARNATFTVIRYNAKPPIGTAYNYEVVIDELEPLAGQQVRSLRQNSLTFANLSQGLRPAAAAPAAVSGDITVREAAEAIRGLFDKKKQ